MRAHLPGNGAVRATVRRMLIALVLIVAPCGLGAAAQPALVLIAPQTPPAAGTTAVFTLYFSNTGAGAMPVVIPARLPVTLTSGGAAIAGALRVSRAADAATVTISAGDHVAVAYLLKIPDGTHGPVTLRLTGPSAEVQFLVRSAPAVEPPPKTDALPEADRPDQLADNFYGHEPVYFLYGPNPDHGKFQISFKYRIMNANGALAQRWPQVANLYFGYTQTSFWDWSSDSAPFFDSSYKPEFFYFEPGIRQRWIPFFDDLDLQTGFQHESNGKDKTDSRSLNNAYLKIKTYLGDRHEAHFTVAPRVWAYLGDLSDNPDIDRYRGYFDVELAYDIPNSLKLSALLRKGTGAGKGSFQIDATYPLSKAFLGNLDIYAQIQYFTGYAETLLRYDDSYSFLRFGFAVYR